MIRCYITDRTKLPPGMELLDVIARNLVQGIDWVQIREKDLSAAELFHLVDAALQLPNPHGTKILVNTRVDVALAAGAAGAHLPSTSPSPSIWKNHAGFLLGVSCHTLDELQRAEDDGADYAIYGPVFPPLSKPMDLAPVGLRGLTEAAALVHIPVLALGGITKENISACLEAGAAGVAGITIFQGSLEWSQPR